MDINQQHRLKRHGLRAAHLITLFIAMSIICLPGLWVVLNSFRPTVEIMAKPPVWIPERLSFDHYRAMFGGVGEGGVPVGRYFLNSLIISVSSTIIAILVGIYVFRQIVYTYVNTIQGGKLNAHDHCQSLLLPTATAY